MENAERIGGGLLGSTRLLDFKGREERRHAERMIASLASHAEHAARSFGHRLEVNREEEERLRRAMAVEITELSKIVRSMLAHMKLAEGNAEERKKLLSSPHLSKARTFRLSSKPIMRPSAID